MMTNETAMSSSDTRRSRSPSVASSRSSRKRKNNRKKKAKEWTYYVANLKSTIDCLYEICRSDQSIIGCKEVLMYLQNADKDFLSLIEAINLEQTFSKEEPHAVAWEIRKSASSPIGVEALSIAPRLMHEMSMNGGQRQQSNAETSPDDGWQIVSHRRRRSSSSTTTESLVLEPEPSLDDISTKPLPSVYERLSSGHYRRAVTERVPSRITISGKLTCPRSAMDLPQTRASLAKMSYVRQQLWEKDVKPSLDEKIARQKRERMQKLVNSGANSGISRINFCDPAAVKKRAKEYSDHLMVLKQKKATAKATSLQSINESGEGDATTEVANSTEPKGIETRSEPPLDLDAEWRELSEEEKSLAAEERSINQEIEKTESELESMDAELARQVDEEAEGHPIVEKEASPPTSSKSDETIKPTPTIGKTLENGLKNFLTNHVIGHIHEPGKLAQIHEKMSSPARRKCDKDDVDFSRKHEEKLRKADAAREKFQQERIHKLQDLAQRREEVRIKQEEIVEKKRICRLKREARMERVQENRENIIDEIVRKAQSDDNKVMEVQFINSLTDSQWHHELHSRELYREERKQTLADERAKKNEERALKEQAAEERRRIAEQNRVKKLQEKEAKRAKQMELAWKKRCSKINVSSASKDFPLGEFSLDSLVDHHKWPETKPMNDAVVCVLCSETMSTKFECFVHIIGNDHLSKAGLSPANFTEELLTKEFAHLKILSRPNSPLHRPESPRLHDKSLCLQDLITYNFKRGNAQFRSLFVPPAVSSEVPEVIVRLLEATESWKDHTPGDGADVVVANVIKFLDKNKEKTESFCEMLTPAADHLLKAIVNWEPTNSSLRLLLRLTALVSRSVVSVSFGLKCLFSAHLHSFFDRINQYSRDNSNSPQLGALLEMCLGLLAPFQRKNAGVPFGITTEAIDDRLNCVFDMVNGFSHRIPSMLRREDTPAKWTRIHNLASFFIDRSVDENSLPIVYIDHLLEQAVEALRISTGVDAVDKLTHSDSDVTCRLANRVMHFCERVQHLRQPAVWTALFNRPCRNFHYFLLLSELLRRSVRELRHSDTAELVPHLLFLLRCFAAHSPSHQILCLIGGEKSVISKICALPDDFYRVCMLAVQTVPTLVLITFDCPFAIKKLMTKRVRQHVLQFIKSSESTQPYRVSLNHVLKDTDDGWSKAIAIYSK